MIFRQQHEVSPFGRRRQPRSRLRMIPVKYFGPIRGKLSKAADVQRLSKSRITRKFGLFSICLRRRPTAGILDIPRALEPMITQL